MRYLGGEPRLRFIMHAALPLTAPHVHLEQLSPTSLDFSLIAEGVSAGGAEGERFVRVPVTVEPPLAYGLEFHCSPGVQLGVCGPLTMVTRKGLSFLEVMAEHAWLI